MLSIERGESALRGDNGIEGGGAGESAGAEVLRCLANKCAIKLIEIALCLFVQQFVAKQISLAGRQAGREALCVAKEFSRATGYQRQCVTEREGEREREAESDGRACFVACRQFLLSWSSAEVATKSRDRERGETERQRRREWERERALAERGRD